MRRPDVFTLDYSHPLAQGLQSLYTFDLPCVMADRVQLGEYGLNGWSNPSNAILRNPDIGRGVIRTDQAGCIVNMIHPGMVASGGAVSLWAYTRSGGIGTVYGKVFLDDPKLGVFFNNTRVGFSACGVNITSLGVVDIGHSHFTWSHFCINWGPTGSFVYHHGELVATGAAPTLDYPAFSTPFCNQADGTRTFDGEIADLAFYNRTLSPAEIAILADRTDPMLGGLIVEERPVLYFDMGGSSAVEGPAVITAESTLALLGQKGAACPATVAASASLGMGGVKGASAPLNIVGTASVEAGGQKSTYGTATISAESALGMGGIKTILGLDKEGPAVIAASASVGMGGIKGAAGQVWIGADSELVAAGVKGGVGSAAWLATGAFQAGKAPDVTPITAAEVARIVRATPRMKTVTASARVKQVRYEVTRA